MTSTSFLTFLESILRFQCLQQRPTSITVNAHIIAQEIGEEWRNTTIFVWYATLLSTLQIIPLVYFAVTNSSMSVVSSIATMESKHPSLFFTFYTNVLITLPWELNISKVFTIYSFYLMRNKGIYCYYYWYYCYYFWLMRLIFPAWRLKKNSTINQPQKFLAPCGQFCKWQEDEANTDDEFDIFPELRAKIPNVPSDTKLSNKTLR